MKEYKKERKKMVILSTDKHLVSLTFTLPYVTGDCEIEQKDITNLYFPNPYYQITKEEEIIYKKMEEFFIFLSQEMNEVYKDSWSPLLMQQLLTELSFYYPDIYFFRSLKIIKRNIVLINAWLSECSGENEIRDKIVFIRLKIDECLKKNKLVIS